MKIFISYRRDDSSGYALNLFQKLTRSFGEDNVFMDIDRIEPGEDFREAIRKAVGTCDVALILIGKQWLSIADQQGRRRLDDPSDWVRLEIAAALANARTRVIPVLVQNARIPSSEELPSELQELAFRNATELSDRRFQFDTSELIKAIERLGEKLPIVPSSGPDEVAESKPIRPDDKNDQLPLPDAVENNQGTPGEIDQPTGVAETNPSPWRWVAIIVTTLAILVFVFFYSEPISQILSPSLATQPGPITGVTASISFQTATPMVVPTETPASNFAVVIFEDTFIDNQNGWLVDPQSTISGGRYTHNITCLATQTSDYCAKHVLMPFDFPKNFRLEIDTTVSDLPLDGKAAIGFYVRKNGDNFYHVNYLITDGAYQFDVDIQQQNPLPLIPETSSGLINKAPMSINRFGIELENSLITPRVNGQNLVQVEDGNFHDAGDSYLVISVSRGSSATIQLDNLMVQEIVPDPEGFVRNYFELLTQKRDYESAWSLLTQSFKDKNSPEGYGSYVRLWENIEQVSINSIDFYEHTKTSAKCEANLTYLINNGNTETYNAKYHLIYDSNRQTWLFESS